MTDQPTNKQFVRRAILMGVLWMVAMALLGVFVVGAMTTMASN
jgi:hypothetical protein